MKKIILLLLFSLGISYTQAQKTNVKDSLKQLLQKEKSDTSCVLLLADLSFEARKTIADLEDKIN